MHILKDFHLFFLMYDVFLLKCLFDITSLPAILLSCLLLYLRISPLLLTHRDFRQGLQGLHGVYISPDSHQCMPLREAQECLRHFTFVGIVFFPSGSLISADNALSSDATNASWR